MNLDFFLLQIAQFDKNNLFGLVILALELFAVFFLQLMQYVSIFLYCIFHSISRIFDFFFHPIIFLNTLLTESDSSWLIYESLKDLEIKTLIVFNLIFDSNTILSCFFFLFLIIGLIFNSCSDRTNFYYYCRTRNT